MRFHSIASFPTHFCITQRCRCRIKTLSITHNRLGSDISTVMLASVTQVKTPKCVSSGENHHCCSHSICIWVVRIKSRDISSSHPLWLAWGQTESFSDSLSPLGVQSGMMRRRGLISAPSHPHLNRYRCFVMPLCIPSRRTRCPLASGRDAQGFNVPATWSHPHQDHTTWANDVRCDVLPKVRTCQEGWRPGGSTHTGHCSSCPFGKPDFTSHFLKPHK